MCSFNVNHKLCPLRFFEINCIPVQSLLASVQQTVLLHIPLVLEGDVLLVASLGNVEQGGAATVIGGITGQ